MATGSPTTSYGIRLLFALAALGVVAGIVAAIVLNQKPKPQPPAFDPVQNPYAHGIYANGIVESDQPNGSNLNLYPEIAGTLVEVPVKPGQAVLRGDVLARLDDRVPSATAEQQHAQLRAAQAQLEALHAQPRPEALQVVQAQLATAEATAQQARDSYDKLQHAFDLDAHAVSREALDSARNGWRVAEASRTTAERQLQLTRAGAWQFDIRSQQAQVEALARAWQASTAVLAKYTLRAPVEATVVQMKASVGSYVTPQGVYDTYTQSANAPLLVLRKASTHLNVRCFVDEILIHRLPAPERMRAQMKVRGTSQQVALEFAAIEPYVIPKIQLSDQRQERVDVRVLPVIFRFANRPDLKLYPGQLVDVFIGE